MPVILQKKKPDYSIVIWQSTEPINFLLENVTLNTKETQEFYSFKSETRKREWLTVRNVLPLLGINPVLNPISYDSNGKPHLKDCSISISHSHDNIAMMKTGGSSIGIDIEHIHPRIETLSKKFLSDAEKDFVTNMFRLEKLHVIWGAKEVLYKIYSLGGIDFKQELLVDPFAYETHGTVSASIKKNGRVKKYAVSYEKVGKFMLTWAIEG